MKLPMLCGDALENPPGYILELLFIKGSNPLKAAGGAYQNYTVAANSISFIKSGLALNKTYCWNVMAVGNGTTIKNRLGPMAELTGSLQPSLR